MTPSRSLTPLLNYLPQFCIGVAVSPVIYVLMVGFLVVFE